MLSHKLIYPRRAAYFLYHAKNVTNLWKQKTLDKISEILCYASVMYLSSEAETMMKRVLKLDNNQLNYILCKMLWPPSLLFLVLTRMIASSEKFLTSSPGSSRFPIWRPDHPPYWKTRRPWDEVGNNLTTWFAMGSRKGREKNPHFCIIVTGKYQRRQVVQNFKVLFCARVVPSRHFYLFSQGNMKRQFDAHKGARGGGRKRFAFFFLPSLDVLRTH